ncbi:hypothetical protein [Paenibacillus solani]|uniref:Lipoprotein n=1 Tax=Paenibacillus solani TaxID=1705565 RepID=A0A0M1N248_9BACL|nr:hypothetical protein [Paenibacillus solani]KOR76039.1 hypothetical protein AM231_25685 [Paenibacillus solani]
MKKISKAIIIMILLGIPLLIVSCTNSSEKKPNVVEKPQENNKPTFKLKPEDISNIIVYDHKPERHKSAEVNKREEIVKIATILNSYTNYAEPHTLKNYRDIEIHMKNGSVLTFMLLNGSVAYVENFGSITFNPPENYEKLKQLIEQIENE